MLNIIRQLPQKAPKEALPFLADLCLCAGYDPSGMNDDSAALLAWAYDQITDAQLDGLNELRRTDSHRCSQNFVYLDTWRFPFGTYNPQTGCQWSRHGFTEWLSHCGFNEPAWTWRALKGLQFGTNPIPLQSLLPPALRGLLDISHAKDRGDAL